MHIICLCPQYPSAYFDLAPNQTISVRAIILMQTLTVPKLSQDGNTIKEIWLWKHRVIREEILGHRVIASGFLGSGSNFVSGGKIFGMPNNCRKALRRLIVVLNSLVHLALRRATVWASCPTVTSSSFLRVIIDAIKTGIFSPHGDNTKETRRCPIVLGRQYD